MATQQSVPEARPENKQPIEAPTPSLLDRIVSESEMARRDAVIVRRAEFDQKQRLARMFANSGCFKDIDKDDQDNWLPEDVSIARAMTKIELGESMGFTAAESMTGIDIIKGRVAVGASLRGAKMQRAGFSWPQMVVTNKGCWMPLCFKGEPMLHPKVNEDGSQVLDAAGKPVMIQVTVSFTEDGARLLGLLDKTASMYKKDPQSMYFARAITRAQRRYGPGVLGIDMLDTYEAKEIEDAGRAGESQRVAQEFGVTSTLGTKQAAQEVAEAKIAKMEAERAHKGCAPGETPADRDARIEKQMTEQLEKAKAEEAARMAVNVEPTNAEAAAPAELKTYDADNPPPTPIREGEECLCVDGKTLRRLRSVHDKEFDCFEWKAVEVVKSSDQPKRDVPVFGRARK